jgi:hypothetical protein
MFEKEALPRHKVGGDGHPTRRLVTVLLRVRYWLFARKIPPVASTLFD